MPQASRGTLFLADVDVDENVRPSQSSKMFFLRPAKTCYLEGGLGASFPVGAFPRVHNRRGCVYVLHDKDHVLETQGHGELFADHREFLIKNNVHQFLQISTVQKRGVG